MGAPVTYVRELSGFRGNACLVMREGQYFVVSTANVPFSGPETLVFRANYDGRVTNWSEVAGGRGMSRDEAIADLSERDAIREGF